MVLKICETKNNVWKRHILSIQNSIDNHIKTTRIKPNFASLNSSHKSGKPYKQGVPGLFLLLCCYFATNSNYSISHRFGGKSVQVCVKLSFFGDYENVSDSVKADIFGFDIAEVSGDIRLFSDVMKRLGIKLDGDELYEGFQTIYDESVDRDW